MKTSSVFSLLIAVTLLLSGCSHSRRAEIEARKAALKHKQDSTLLATQQELATVDSMLLAVSKQYTQMEAQIGERRKQLKATEQEQSALNQLRMHRDSLQVQWQTLGAKIRYIRKKQEELAGKE